MRDARARTLALVADLSTEQLMVPVLDIVNPFIWEMGHVACFYDAFLLRQLGRQEPVMEGSDDLYDSFTVDHEERWRLSLPSREGTLEYMARTMDLAIERLGAGEPDEWETYLALLSALHEDMHGEAFTHMRQTLGYRVPQLEVEDRGGPNREGPLPGDVEVPGGAFQLGASRNDAFVFDNEKWAHPVEMDPFRIARAPVTNSQFAEFVEDRGYLRRELWSRRGWDWRVQAGLESPLYWTRGGGGWLRRDFEEEASLEEHAPVMHVSWYESEAWCNWASRRLPTEAEWEMAAAAQPIGEGTGGTALKRQYPWGDDPPTPERANLDSRLMGCADVAGFAAGDSAFGCRQMLGNVWEWTASPFYPYPGYVVDLPYREYSAPWFGDRRVLKGGAWATRSRLVNNRYRNFYPPDRNDVFAGFRTCARES